jgi:hypothetical protein
MTVLSFLFSRKIPTGSFKAGYKLLEIVFLWVASHYETVACAAY